MEITARRGAATRSWLFVPAHRERMVQHALDAGSDAVVLDLEDSVPDAEKDDARGALAAVLGVASEAAAPARYVRVNASEDYTGVHADLEAAVRPGLTGLVVPKMESPDQVGRLSAYLDVWERQRALESGTVLIALIIESPRAIVRASELASASRRVRALLFGGEDYRRELSLPVDIEPSSAGLTFARTKVAVDAAANGVSAVDGVWTDLDDAAGLLAEARTAREIGFNGKLAIHPKQLEAIHEAFSPSPAEIRYAREVVAAYDEAVAQGQGAVAFRGRMLDVPVVQRAHDTLEQAGLAAESSE